MANAKKLKVGFVFDDSLDTFDGVAQYVKTLGAWMGAQGHEVCYLVGQTKMSNWAGGKVYSLAKNQKVTFNGNQARIPLPANKERINQVLNDQKFDVLHVQVPYSPFLAKRIINQADRSTAIVGTFHVAPGSFFSKWGGHLLRLSYGKSLRRFDTVLSVSSAAADYAKTAFGLQTNILPNVVDYEKFMNILSPTLKTTAGDAEGGYAAVRSVAGTVGGRLERSSTLRDEPLRLRLEEQDPRGFEKSGILFFGRLVKRKGAGELVEAFSILHKKDPSIKLTIAGDGPERKNLQKLADGFGISGAVTFLGFIQEADKPALLASAGVVCFPSLGGESFGIVLLEAMAAGARIVIGGDNPGYRTVLGEHPELLFDPANTKVFADKLAQFLEVGKMVDELHDWQQKEVKKYDVNVVGPKLLDIYVRAIAKHKVNGHN